MTSEADERGGDPLAPMSLTGALERRSGWDTRACPAGATLQAVGTRSAVLLMREALYGTTRFDDFVARVGVTEPVAAKRLRELTDVGLLRKVPYREPGARTRHEYRLTGMGADFAPVVMALYEWGAKHLTGPAGPPLAFRHTDCGAPVHVELVCDEGHRPTLDEVDVETTRHRRATPVS